MVWLKETMNIQSYQHFVDKNDYDGPVVTTNVVRKDELIRSINELKANIAICRLENERLLSYRRTQDIDNEDEEHKFPGLIRCNSDDSCDNSEPNLVNCGVQATRESLILYLTRKERLLKETLQRLKDERKYNGRDYVLVKKSEYDKLQKQIHSSSDGEHQYRIKRENIEQTARNEVLSSSQAAEILLDFKYGNRLLNTGKADDDDYHNMSDTVQNECQQRLHKVDDVSPDSGSRYGKRTACNVSMKIDNDSESRGDSSISIQNEYQQRFILSSSDKYERNGKISRVEDKFEQGNNIVPKSDTTKNVVNMRSSVKKINPSINGRCKPSKKRKNTSRKCPCGLVFTNIHQNSSTQFYEHGQVCPYFQEFAIHCPICEKGFIDVVGLNYHALKSHIKPVGSLTTSSIPIDQCFMTEIM